MPQEKDDPYQFYPEQYPPNIKLVDNHYKANKVGIPVEQDEDDDIDYCLCCSKPIHKYKIKYNIDLEDMGFLGPMFPIYFKFIKYCIALCLLICLTNIYSFFINYNGNKCQELQGQQKCSDNNQVKFTSFNSKSYKTQSIINIITVILIQIFLQFYIWRLRIQKNKADKSQDTPSDYSIMLSNLPQGKYNKEDIEKLLYQYVRRNAKNQQEIDDFQIEKIDLAYKLDTFYDLLRQKKQIVEKKIRYQKKEINLLKRSFVMNKIYTSLNRMGMSSIKQKILHYNTQQAMIQNKIDQLEQKVQDGDVSTTTGDVIVTFKKQNTKEFILKRCKLNDIKLVIIKIKMFFLNDQDDQQYLNKYLVYDDNLLRTIRAPEPNDIIWVNLGRDSAQLIKTQIFTNLIMFILLLTSASFIYLIYHQQEQFVTNNSDSNFTLVFTLVASISIVIINKLLLVIIHKLTSLEKQPSYSKQSTVIATRLSLSQFINTSLIIILVENFLKDRQFQTSNGLIDNSFGIFISNAFVTPLLNYFDFSYFYKLYLRKKVIDPKQNKFITQQEAHQIFTNPQFQIETKYAQIFNSLFLTAFYVPLNPFVAPISLAGLIFYYFLEKYLILYRYQEPILLSPNINKHLADYLDIIPLLMSLGGFYFHYNINQKVISSDMLIDFLSIGLSLINLIVPSMQLNKKFFKVSSESNNPQTYQEIKDKFYTEYDRANPITQEEAIENWIEQQQNKNNSQNKDYVNQVKQIYDKDINDIDQINKLKHKARHRDMRNNQLNFIKKIKHKSTLIQDSQALLENISNNEDINQDDIKKQQISNNKDIENVKIIKQQLTFEQKDQKK